MRMMRNVRRMRRSQRYWPPLHILLWGKINEQQCPKMSGNIAKGTTDPGVDCFSLYILHTFCILRIAYFAYSVYSAYSA